MLGFDRLQWSLNVGVSPAFITPAYHAALAVAPGHADTVMAFRIMMQQPPAAALAAGGAMLGAPSMVDAQFHYPFGNFSPTQWAGLLMKRYMHETGATEETFATFAEIQRDWALMNDDALQRTPLSRRTSSPRRTSPSRCGSSTATTRATRARR